MLSLMECGHPGNFLFLSCQERAWINRVTSEIVICTFELYQRDITDGQKLEFAVEPVIGLDRLSFDSFAMKDVDHDVLWKLSSKVANSTSNVRKLAVVYRDVVEGKAATGETELVRSVCEELCYMTLYFDTEHNSTAEPGNLNTCELPDGNILTVGADLFHCAEVLYQPSFIDIEACGFHDTSFVSFMKCDADVRKNLYTFVTMPCEKGDTASPDRLPEYTGEES